MLSLTWWLLYHWWLRKSTRRNLIHYCQKRYWNSVGTPQVSWIWFVRMWRSHWSKPLVVKCAISSAVVQRWTLWWRSAWWMWISLCLLVLVWQSADHWSAVCHLNTSSVVHAVLLCQVWRRRLITLTRKARARYWFVVRTWWWATTRTKRLHVPHLPRMVGCVQVT